MDDQSKVVTEVTNFYRAITAPFLDRMPDNEKEKAILWSQKVLDSRNYDSMVKYLTFLTFMIISGHLVTPFDSDPYTSQIPPLPVHFGETKMLDYIEKVVAQCQAVQDNEDDHQCSDHANLGNISAVVSNDELAFLSTQPTPGVGIRLYLATSAQPFSMWSKAEGAPQATKYDVPARDVIERGLSLAKDKFYSYLEEIEKINRCPNCRRPSNAQQEAGGRRLSINVSQQEARNDRSFASRSRESEDFDSSEINFNESNASGANQNANEPSTSRDGQNANESNASKSGQNANESNAFRTGKNANESNTSRVSQNAMPRAARSVTRAHPAEVASTAERPPQYALMFKTKPPEPMSEEDRRKEAEVEAKSRRWFPVADYDPYREDINNFIRGGAPIDYIRRTVHKLMRRAYQDPGEAPFFTLDSEDEGESTNDRILHLRMRFIDVLQKEYGLTNEAELYYLAGVTGLSDRGMTTARSLIKKAEEGLVTPAFKERFRSAQGRTCGRLMTLVNELLDSTNDEDIVGNDPCAPNQTRAASVPNQTAAVPAHRAASVPGTSRISRAPARRIARMPPTCVLDERSDDTDSNRSYIENEPEPEYFRTMHELEDSKNSTQKESNQRRERPPDSQESNDEPDGRVYPRCPRENC